MRSETIPTTSSENSSTCPLLHHVAVLRGSAVFECPGRAQTWACMSQNLLCGVAMLEREVLLAVEHGTSCESKDDGYEENENGEIWMVYHRTG